MAKELVFHYWCDNAKAAKHKPRTVTGETLLVWVRPKEKLVEVDICESCQVKVTDADMQDLAVRFGREPIQPEVDAERLICPLGCQGNRAFASLAGRTRHIRLAARRGDEAHQNLLDDYDDYDYDGD